MWGYNKYVSETVSGELLYLYTHSKKETVNEGRGLLICVLLMFDVFDYLAFTIFLTIEKVYKIVLHGVCVDRYSWKYLLNQKGLGDRTRV